MPRYAPEFRAEAIRLVTEYSRPITQVADEIGVNQSTLRVWLQRAKNQGPEMADDTDEQESVKDLKRRLKETEKALRLARSENEFLKKASSFFAAEASDHHNGSK